LLKTRQRETLNEAPWDRVSSLDTGKNQVEDEAFFYMGGRMLTQTLNINEVKTQLSHLVEEVATGSEIIIAKRGKPIARLSRIEVDKPEIRFGVLKGKVKEADDFDAPLPDEILAEFEGQKCSS
jgi:prevent-host-death family protein